MKNLPPVSPATCFIVACLSWSAPLASWRLCAYSAPPTRVPALLTPWSSAPPSNWPIKPPASTAYTATCASVSIESVSRNLSSYRFSMRTRFGRSEEHTSELQSQSNLVCRLLLEKKKKKLKCRQRLEKKKTKKQRI